MTPPPTTPNPPFSPSDIPTEGLTSRQWNEQRFHDAWAAETDVSALDPAVSFEAITAVEGRYILSRMGDLAGRRILDLGCGSGEAAVYFARRGAVVSACDISPGFVDLAGRLAHHHGVTLQLDVCPAERLPYPPKSFDFVFANGVLHHVDVSLAMAELKRILKPEGRGFFIEPLPYNPLINVYRWIAREVRTPDEQPLTFDDIAGIRRLFPKTRVEYFWFFTLGVFLSMFLIERASTRERYWKKILYEADRYKGVFSRLKRWDDWILPRLPFLKPLCWNRVIEIQAD